MRTQLRSVILSIPFWVAGLSWPALVRAECPGDCNENGAVSVDELVKTVNIALDRMPLGSCPSADADGNGALDIGEVMGAVNTSIEGCPDPCAGQELAFASTFEAIQKQIFERRGCTESVCHSSSARQGGLDLSPAVAYRNLFEVPSTQADMKRVTPGARDRSFLYLKLAAATDPSQLPSGFQLAGSPMPSGFAPLSTDELEAIRLWIYNGAPETGTVIGTDALLGACLPPPAPITIAPLEPPAPGAGVQFVMPPWDLVAQSEFEGCFATYYDFTEQVPEEFRSASGTQFFWKGFEVRQDPQSHHLLLYYSPLNFAPGGVDVHHRSFGAWTCRGGPRQGERCEPTDLASCGEGGICASQLRPSFACVGYGPPSDEPSQIVGGAPQAQSNFLFAPGVYQALPLKGVMYWNAHAFNATDRHHVMNGRVNYYFASERTHPAVRISDFSAIFRPNNPPFTKETFCNDHVFPIGSRVFELFAHTHKHGEYYWVTDPSGHVIYENRSYSDPVVQRYDPPLAFDSPNRAERTVRYCAVFNNGVAANGAPDIDLVTRASRVPPVAQQFVGKCTPVACVEGKVTAACEKDADCDSTPGNGDGWCDACPITGGESTENEMFVLFGAQYIDPTVPGAQVPTDFGD